MGQEKYVIGVDGGTESLRAAVYSLTGNVCMQTGPLQERGEKRGQLGGCCWAGIIGRSSVVSSLKDRWMGGWMHGWMDPAAWT
eukprot:364938-Chlamydomonas_euryale.AAC.35